MVCFRKKIYSVTLIAVIISVMVMMCARAHVVHVSDGHIFTTEQLHEIAPCQNVVVLGARVYDDGRMSGILRERAMAVVDLYRAGKVCAIMISGDGSGTHGGDEIAPVTAFFVAQGIDASVIMEDGQGFDTFQSMKNLRERFFTEDVLIVTQQFHLPRSVYIARSMGINAHGYTAYKYPYKKIWKKWRDRLREYPAAVKAVYEVHYKQ